MIILCQGKYNLAVQEFRAALALGFKESLPFCIYNLSLLYRKMEATDAELGVFNLLTAVSLFFDIYHVRCSLSDLSIYYPCLRDFQDTFVIKQQHQNTKF